MTTKTREEAIEEVKTEIAGDVLNGSIVKNYEERSDSLRYQYWNKNQTMSDDPCTVIVKFTPPKPEFEKGTFGLDDDGWIGLYHSTGNRYIKMAYRTRDLEDASSLHNTSTFTPIYQTDPIEKLAFELMREEFYNSISDQKMDPDQLKAHFLSRAKEELSK